MKVLIQDYSSKFSSESKYLTASLHQARQQSYLWDSSKIPAFDIFNRFSPDLFITNINSIDEHVLKCLAKFQTKTLVNITKSPIDIQTIKDTFYSMGINNYRLFTNEYWQKDVECVLPAFDPFCATVREFDIPLGVVSNNDLEEAKSVAGNKEVYHLINFSNERAKGFDFNIDIEQIGSLSNYRKTIMSLPGKLCCSQIFFQATVRANELKIQATEDQDIYDKFFEFVFEPEETTTTVENVIKRQIARNHTSFNRAQQLLEMWQFQEARILDDIIKKIGEANG